MTTYEEKLKKRAIELQQSGMTQQQVSTKLNVEKKLWYFGTNEVTPPAPQMPAQRTPTNSTTPQAPATPKAPQELSRVKKLAKQNAWIIQQQQPPTTPEAPPLPPVQQTASYDGTKPVNTPMDALWAWMQGIEQQWQRQEQEIMRQYQDDIAMIRLGEDQVKNQFKNADQVMSWIKAVEDAYKQGIFDPQQIAQTSWIPVDQIQRVLRGEAFKDLQLQDRVAPEERRKMEQDLQQLWTIKGRNVDDLATQAERSKYNYDTQVEDIMRQAWLSQASMNKMWALTWWIQSSGYRTAIDLVRQEANRWLDRLKTVQWREQDDIAKARTRLLEDFETNTKNIKQYFDTGMNTLRMQSMATIQKINHQYGVASDNTVKALKELYTDMENQKWQLLNETIALQTSFNNMWTQEIDILEKRATSWTWDRNKDIQTYLDLYKTNPALANSMFPELANQVNNNNFQNFDLSLDFTTMPDVIKQFPKEARAKNNNPGGIKTASPELQQAWRDAGINFQTWTKPPPWENQANPYTKFATIGDGLKAQWIALSRNWGDINKRLQAWVGTWEWPNYAQQVMWRAGIPQGTTFQQLTAEQQQSLQTAIIRKESPWLYKLMTGAGAWTPWMPGSSTPLSPEAQSVIDGAIGIDKIPSADRIRILQEIQTNGKQVLSTKVVWNAKKSIDLVEEILKSPWFWWAVWRSRSKLWGLKEAPIAWTPAYDTYQKIKSLESLIAIPYLENMKWLGAMSEKEFTAMKDASSAMNSWMTETWFKEEMKKIVEAMNSMITRNGWEAYKPTQQSTRSPTASWFKIDPNK